MPVESGTGTGASTATASAHVSCAGRRRSRPSSGWSGYSGEKHNCSASPCCLGAHPGYPQKHGGPHRGWLRPGRTARPLVYWLAFRTAFMCNLTRNVKTCQMLTLEKTKALNRGVRLCLVLRRQDLARLREKRSARTGGASRRGSAASSAGSYSGVGASLRAPPLRAPLPRSRSAACGV